VEHTSFNVREETAVGEGPMKEVSIHFEGGSIVAGGGLLGRKKIFFSAQTKRKKGHGHLGEKRGPVILYGSRKKKEKTFKKKGKEKELTL